MQHIMDIIYSFVHFAHALLKTKMSWWGQKAKAFIENEKERECTPSRDLTTCSLLLPCHPAWGSLKPLSPLLKLLAIWVTWTFPLINPDSVHFLVVACSQACLYGWPFCVSGCMGKCGLSHPPRWWWWWWGVVGAKRAVKWQLWGTAGPVDAAPSVALLFLHYLTFDCLYVLHDKDIWATAL